MVDNNMSLKPIPINQGNLQHQQGAAISDVMDAIVELVTNSDDSYRRMGKAEGGRIVVHISREKGGVLRELAVVDSAQGMTQEKLKAALTKFEDSSDRAQFPGIRGAFGRGLKDTIFAIGQGRIITRSRITKKLLETRLVWDDGVPQFDDNFAPRPATRLEDNQHWFGTIVTVKPDKGHPSDIRVPEPRTIAQRLPRHYALRDIVRRHDVRLSWKRVAPLKGRTTESKAPARISPVVLPGKCVLEDRLQLPTFKDVIVTVYESEEPLEGTSGDPWCLFGFTVTSEGVPLDHRVFLDSRAAAPYFWGTIEIPEIGYRLSHGEGASRYSLLSDDRSGLPWNRRPCREELTPAIRKILAPLFEEKEKKLREGAGEDIEALPDERKWLDFLNSRMYAWFEQRSPVIREQPPGPPGGGQPGTPPTTSPPTTLSLAPELAYVPPGGERSFSVYVPRGMSGVVSLSVTPPDRAVTVPLRLRITPDMAAQSPSGAFKVTVVAGAQHGQKVLVQATLGNHMAYATIVIGEESHKPPGERPQPKPRGMAFTGIELDPQPNPDWRVRYDLETGKIIIYARYPTVGEVMGRGRRWLASRESRILLAELIAEAVCRAAVLRDKDLPQSVELTRAVAEFDKRRAKCIKDIYQFAGAYKA